MKQPSNPNFTYGTLCDIYIITTKQGDIFGFTNHDMPITFNNTLCQPHIVEGQGSPITIQLNEDSNYYFTALFYNTAFNPLLWQGAEIVYYKVNWQNPTIYTTILKGHFSNIFFQNNVLKAEVKTLFSKFQNSIGRQYGRKCDANFGDAKCTLNLQNHTYNSNVNEVLNLYSFTAIGLNNFANGWFENGTLKWLSGTNMHTIFNINKFHITAISTTKITLNKSCFYPIQQNDTFEITTGCNKIFQTCKNKFNNAVNFQGFPHIPGTQFLFKN